MIVFGIHSNVFIVLPIRLKTFRSNGRKIEHVSEVLRSRVRPMPIQACVNCLSNIGFIYADIICRLKIHFSNNNESFFNLVDNLISKTRFS